MENEQPTPSEDRYYAMLGGTIAEAIERERAKCLWLRSAIELVENQP